MANSYKFKGTALATTSQTTLLSADTNETIIIKSIIVTNNTGNTPTVTLDDKTFDYQEGYTVQIKIGMKHRVQNDGEEELIFI